MKKYFILMFILTIGLILGFASGNKTTGSDTNLPGKPNKSKNQGNFSMSSASVKVDDSFGNIPLYFISNNGQVHNSARFYAKASRYTLWLTKQGLVFDSVKRVKTTHPAPSGHPSQEGNNRGLPHSLCSSKMERDVSQLIFQDANKNPGMVPIEKKQLKVNYFIGNDKSKWYNNIPTSGAVLYKNLYKNIDLKVYGIEKQIEYDWIVKPGGNLSHIRFKYNNVKATRVDEEGNLLVLTKFGQLVHKKPAAFQENHGIHPSNAAVRIPVSVSFKKIKKNIYGFEVGEYDKKCELVIDPVVWTYSTYLGGNGDDISYGIAADNSGCVYVTGSTGSTDFPTLDQYQNNQTASDVFVTKIDTTQAGASSLVYSTYLGGGNPDYGSAIAVDNSGYVYVTGSTWSDDFPILSGYQTTRTDSTAFVTKLDMTQAGAGGLLYSTYLGGTDRDEGKGIAVDAGGNAYVTGYTDSTDFPILGQYQTDQQNRDAFVTKLDTTQSGAASLIYSTYLGGTTSDEGSGISIDASGNAYVTGYTASPNFPILGQYQTDQYIHDAFLTKLDTTQSGASSLIYSTYLGGDAVDRGEAISVDSSGNAYITGYTASTDFPTLNQYQAFPGGLTYAFVTRIDTTQTGADSLIYSTYLGGDIYDYGSGIAVDSSRNVYVTGRTLSRNFPILNQYLTDDQRHWDAFVTKLDTTQGGASSLIYSTYLGGDAEDRGEAIAVDSSGNVYVTGGTWSTDFPIQDQYQAVKGYRVDAFVTKLICCVDLPVVTTAPVSSLGLYSAESGGEVIWQGEAPVIARGVCWSIYPNVTIYDNYTTSGTGTGVFTSAITGLTLNTTYYLKAFATTTQGTAYGNTETFTTLGHIFTITSPNGGETWEGGSSHTITWTSKGIGIEDIVNLEYSTNNGIQWIGIAENIENDGSNPWTVPNVISNQCLVRIRDTSGRVLDVSDRVFSIGELGTITVISPNGGETWPFRSTHNITWTAPGVSGRLEITLWKNQRLVGIIAKNIDPASGSYTWLVGDLGWSACLVGTDFKIKIKENGTPVYDMSDNNFTLTR